MADRYRGLVVTFDKDYRDDDAQYIIDAIKMIKGVIDVKPVVGNWEQDMIEDKVRLELRKKLFDVLK